MSRTVMTWFRLRFPRELPLEAVQAALAGLSGAPHRTRLIFELTGDHQGVHHRVGVSRSHADLVVGGLRAAIPSLGLETEDAPTVRSFNVQTYWQLAPHGAALRVDDPAASAATLLAGFLPLGRGEVLQLAWTLQPGPRPPLVVAPSDRATGRALALRQKLAGPGLIGRGALRVRAASPARRRQLMQRASSALWSLRSPHGRLLSDASWLASPLYWLGARGRYFSTNELVAVIGWPVGSPTLPGLELGAARRLAPSRKLPKRGRVLGFSDYGSLQRPVALSAGASTRGLYILGPTGTGKTSLIKNLVLSDLEAGRGLAVVETNGDLITDILNLIPPRRMSDVVLLDPTDPDYAVGFNPFGGSDDYALVADRLAELFHRLWSAFWGPRTDQLAHMALMTLAQRPGSTLLDLPRLYLDPAFRGQVLRGLDDPVGLEPDWRWFTSLGEREQATVVAPLLNKVRSFTARPSIRAIVGQAQPAISIGEVVARGKVLLVNLPKGIIGTETATLLGSLVLIGLWQTMTERARLAVAQRQPFALYCDEIQDFAHAPIPWSEVFAQGRKYAFAATVAHQNLDQLPRELREAILANARSKAVFSLSASDAKTMAKSFEPELTPADLQALDPYHLAAIVALDDGGISPPVTLRTPPPPPDTHTADRVRQLSRRRYARPRADIEAALRESATGPKTPVGRRRRSQS